MTHPQQDSHFCMRCGGPLSMRPWREGGEDKLVCGDCGFVHHMNPRPVAGIIAVRDDGRILLVRRAIRPIGRWVFPGGFMDLGETPEEAATRETREEAHLEVRDLSLFAVYSRPGPWDVVIVYDAKADGDAKPGDETTEVGWFSEGEIPWDELAFETTKRALQDYLDRREAHA
jgi:ADP-ribose pyrophosphatase YjhB (NUDIX family)